tara:strand:+ start:7473 stop:7580 length:108 start_codon:yes stop_codon:yes gene_type:complete
MDEQRMVQQDYGAHAATASNMAPLVMQVAIRERIR